MHVWNGLGEIPADLGRCVVALGNFDGVHVGHQAVLRTLVEQAAARRTSSVAVTFDPHPIAVLRPDLAPPMLTSLARRLALIEATGVDGVVVIEFTAAFAAETPEEFVRTVFVDRLHAQVVVVGHDTRFGVRNTGSVETLVALGERYGFEVIALEDVGTGSRWSSSQVRGLVAAGDVAGAAELLGRPHRVDGTVVHGDHRGRLLGFPTANLGHDTEGMVPADGVYAGWLTRLDLPADAPDRVLPTAISIGTNPTFDGTERRVEGYVLDRTDLDLYGERIAYEFVAHLRPTLKFDGMDPLIVQMNEDVEQCRLVLRTIVRT
ncbi:MAG: bifunctional riboflavin kinase/FAD synthetase [Dermatophilaceae bacterium]